MHRLTPVLAAIAVLVLIACGGTPAPALATRHSPSPQTFSPGPTGPDACHVNGVRFCVLNAAVTQATLGQTICHPGWTATIRPPQSYTGTLKRDQLAVLHSQHPTWTAGNTELDHRLALELGGHPTDPGNLSPEFADAATPKQPFRNRKDADEDAFKRRICAGEPLAQAQAEFIDKWLAPWPDYKAVA